MRLVKLTRSGLNEGSPGSALYLNPEHVVSIEQVVAAESMDEGVAKTRIVVAGWDESIIVDGHADAIVELLSEGKRRLFG
jgi:hypothetical protein